VFFPIFRKGFGNPETLPFRPEHQKDTLKMQAEICPKCSKFKLCKSPCYPVKQLLAKDNLSVYEKTVTKKNGETITILFARSREPQQSMLSIGVDSRGDPLK